MDGQYKEQTEDRSMFELQLPAITPQELAGEMGLINARAKTFIGVFECCPEEMQTDMLYLIRSLHNMTMAEVTNRIKRHNLPERELRDKMQIVEFYGKLYAKSMGNRTMDEVVSEGRQII